MSKRKKRKPQPKMKRPSAKTIRELAAAMEIYEDGDVALARQQLLQLAHKNPRSKPVLLALVEVSAEIEDWRTLAYYSEKLVVLEQGEDQAETRNNLIYAYVQLLMPALAWQHAQLQINETTTPQFVASAEDLIEKVEPMLLAEAGNILGETNFTQEEKFNLLALHDRVRFLTESQHPEEAIHAAKTLLEKYPNAIPILNNMSLSQFMMGDIEQAITTAQNVLDQDPNNFHALGNLVRFTFLTAHFEEAQTYAQRLQHITSDSLDLEMKQAEAFAFIGDDVQVWAAYERAKNKSKHLPPLFLHLAAVAAYRMDNEKSAWQLWRRAVKVMPSFDLAQESLAERGLPVNQRDIPWYWSFSYWFPQDFGPLLQKYLGTNIQQMSEQRLERGMKGLLAERPYLPKLFAHMLERGDRETREFAFNIIQLVQTPELLQICYDFAQSPHGTDEMRMEAMQFISQNHPAMLPEDKMVSMWINGQQTELFMLGFEITDEPEGVEGVSDAILDKHETAYNLLMNDELEEAEVLLQEIIAEAPEFYSAYNQLAVVYSMQGRTEEAHALVEETHERFPDYFFARIALARIRSRDGQTEEAKDLIQPLLRLPKLHISEFRALAQAQMDIALAEGQTEAARNWLNMWEQIEDDNPDIFPWKMRIEGPKLLEGLQNLMSRSRKKKPAKRRKK